MRCLYETFNEKIQTNINSNMSCHNEQCKPLRKDFIAARNKLNKYKTKDSHYASQKAGTTYNRCCKVQKAKHDARMTALHIRQKHSNSRLFWRSIKPHVHSECHVTLTQFYTHFLDISNPNNSKITSTPTPNHTHTVEQLDRSITLEEVDQSNSALKHHKTRSYDNVLNECIIFSNTITRRILTSLFNHILTHL